MDSFRRAYPMEKILTLGYNLSVKSYIKDMKSEKVAFRIVVSALSLLSKVQGSRPGRGISKFW